MRRALPAVLAAALSTGLLVADPAHALGLVFEFPTLTWPIGAPGTTPATPGQPAIGCTDPASLTPPPCPPPSR